MPEQTNNTSVENRKWIVFVGGFALLVIAVAVGLLLRGGGKTDPADPQAEARLVARRTSVRVKQLMDAGKFPAAAESIEKFLRKHPDAPGLSRLWAMKVVCHRKAGDLTNALLGLAEIAEKYHGNPRDLCEAGDVLAEYECFSDAVKAFELASEDETLRARACYQAAMCNYRLGRFGAAMKYIDVVAALKPDDPKIIAAVKRIEDARFVLDE
ncbi:MAG: tetratricopeptide repeat protein [Phycisphaerae bacterium]|jgi:tetratricopeptide (TPR) repeat protein|nr:tetratricopeptide repeat protein [Phycisphaerae bacterium]